MNYVELHISYLISLYKPFKNPLCSPGTLSMDVKLGLLSESQFPALMALFKEENYIYPEDYVNYCYQTDPEGFFVATDIQGTIISNINYY